MKQQREVHATSTTEKKKQQKQQQKDDAPAGRPVAASTWTGGRARRSFYRPNGDDARAARIRAERGAIVFDEVDPGPWRRDLTPYLAAGADVTADGVRVAYYRPRVVFSTPAGKDPLCEG